jgi:uncharacterized protein (DUF1810 family)
MTETSNLERFVDAQKADFPVALSEIQNGRKRSHWMWYIFPQLQGLGHSATSRYYALKDSNEAADFLRHPVLGKRLIQICSELLNLESNDASQVFGNPDDLKLKSSMTLFALLPETDPVFALVLKKFFYGAKDDRTVHLVQGGS